jgi:hypothetical protein
MRVAALLVLSASLAACSSQPTTPQAGPAATPTVAPATPEASAAPVAEPEAAPAEAVSVAKPAGKIPSGYRRETRNGRELFCRSVTTLGSRFPQKTCFTREQIEKMQREAEDTMDDFEQGMRVCGGGAACGNGG